MYWFGFKIFIKITEYPIKHPQKKHRKWHSEKKRHTIKAQIVVNNANGEIICTAEDYGKTHNFALYKNTIENHVLYCIKKQADSGY